MPSISGSFSGQITKQSGIPVDDQPNHQLGIGEVNGIQSSPDPLWDNAKISYWAITDLVDGKGTQNGYFNDVHPDGGRDYGTFEGQVTSAGGEITVEGKFTFTGGDGAYKGITGGGTFKTVTKSETDVQATWNGAYELAKAQAG
jgi:hypothetical protein